MAFCLFLLIILTGVLLGIARMLHQNYGKDYKGISSFYVYQTDDGIKSTFETFRLIQCKRIFLSQIEYRFKWSGTIMPRIFSNSQRIENIKHYSDAQQWDSAILRFFKPYTSSDYGDLFVEDGDTFTFTAPTGKKFTKGTTPRLCHKIKIYSYFVCMIQGLIVTLQPLRE